MGRLSKKKVRLALEKHLGNVTKAAKACNVTRGYLYQYMNKYPDLLDVRDEAREELVDNVENKAYEVAMRGNVPLLKYFLSTQGKDRGYVERQEYAGVDDKPIVVSLKKRNE